MKYNITAKTKKLALIGNPVSHSYSPLIQNTALAMMHLDYVYTAMPVQKESLEDAVRGLKALGFSGFNVTLPYKSAIMQYLDEVDSDARAIGSVNTVTIKNGRTYGSNTDSIGFINALLHINFPVEKKRAVVMGAGGSARAVIYSLLQYNIDEVCILARHLQKAEQIASDFAKAGKVTTCLWTESNQTQVAAQLAKADLLVNTTPLGMHPHINEIPPVDLKALKEGALVYDIIYTPEKTTLLTQAQQNGHLILNGEFMLAGQGAAALEKWLGIKVDIDILRIALHNALKEQNDASSEQ